MTLIITGFIIGIILVFISLKLLDAWANHLKLEEED
jgi:hypothetical protein